MEKQDIERENAVITSEQRKTTERNITVRRRQIEMEKLGEDIKNFHFDTSRQKNKILTTFTTCSQTILHCQVTLLRILLSVIVSDNFIPLKTAQLLMCPAQKHYTILCSKDRKLGISGDKFPFNSQQLIKSFWIGVLGPKTIYRISLENFIFIHAGLCQFVSEKRAFTVEAYLTLTWI